MPRTVWIDVEGLFQYARANPRPSGIQRVEYELCRALASLPDTGPDSAAAIRFVRHAPLRNSFRIVSFQQVEALYGGMVAPRDGGPPRRRARPSPLGAPRGALREEGGGSPRHAFKRAVYRLPDAIRAPLIDLLVHQRDACLALMALARASAAAAAAWARATAGRLAASRGPAPVSPADSPEAFDAQAGSGDVLLMLGAPWFHPDYASVINRARQRHGLRFAMLLYDIIPLRRPEWVEHGLVRLFTSCMRAVLPLADVLPTISRASAEDVERYAAETGLRLRARPCPIPVGTGFTRQATRADAALVEDRAPPPADSYALIVGTIEARKNHVLLLRVWRRLLDELPAAAVPTLVFAGHVGWLVADLMQQLGNAGYLDGKIVLCLDPTDSELAALYRGCRFTLFPSFYEGWGLPVTESLSFGRPCLASSATSLPEAGGALARYFDPDNAVEAYQVIRDTILDPEGLRAWQDRVAREFTPVSWEESARALRLALDADAAG
jgi:glycosyltransferase involved in cell wall biosynthesis